MSEQQRIFLAFILSGFIIFGWQFFQSKKVVPKLAEIETTETVDGTATSSEIVAAEETVELSNFFIKNEKIEFELTNDLSIYNILGSNDPFSEIVGDNPLKVYRDNSPIYLNTEEEGNRFRGTSTDVVANISVNENSMLQVDLKANNTKSYQIALNTTPLTMGNKHRSFAYYLNNDLTFLTPDKAKEDSGVVKWIAIDYNYYLFAIIFEDGTNAKISLNGNRLMVTTNEVADFSYKVFFGLKKYDQLDALGDNLKASIDFGMLSIIAVPILRVLQFFYKYIPNYGVAIILLTVLVRLITYPLQARSMSNMKKMQTLQPKLNDLKERYKDDPQSLNLKTMELFKTEKVNPMGGCFPLLLQMPIFFAFYRVLYNAVELVNSPFFGWLKDLSKKDPYYILPILMTLTMLGQQMLMPSAIDPKQKKMMLFMPLIFGIIMKDLPSGLALYFFTSTLLAMLQQVLIGKRT